MYCEKCGKENLSKENYCKHCGHKLIITENVVNVNGGQSDIPQIVDNGHRVIMPNDVGVSMQNNKVREVKNKDKSLSALVLLIIGGTALVLSFFLGGLVGDFIRLFADIMLVLALVRFLVNLYNKNKKK